MVQKVLLGDKGMKHQLNDIAEISGLRLQDVADIICWATEKHWPLEKCVLKTDGEVHEIWFEEQGISVNSIGQRFLFDKSIEHLQGGGWVRT